MDAHIEFSTEVPLNYKDKPYNSRANLQELSDSKNLKNFGCGNLEESKMGPTKSNKIRILSSETLPIKCFEINSNPNIILYVQTSENVINKDKFIENVPFSLDLQAPTSGNEHEIKNNDETIHLYNPEVHHKQEIPLKAYPMGESSSKIDSNISEATVIIPETEWNRDSVETLILFYFNNLKILQNPCEITANNKLAELSQHISKTPHMCKNKFYELEKFYLELKNSQKIPEEIEWPYYDLFLKIDQLSQTSSDVDISQPKTNSEVVHISEKNIKLLEAYVEHKNLFKCIELSCELQLWSTLCTEIGLKPEECAYRIRILRHIHSNIKTKTVTRQNPKSKVNYYFSLCQRAFNQIEPEIKINTKINAKKWEHEEIKELIDHYERNYQFIVNTGISEAWSVVAKKLSRSPRECNAKISMLKKRHLNLKSRKLVHPNLKISWRHYEKLDSIYEKHKTSEDSTSSTLEDIIDRFPKTEKRQSFNSALKGDDHTVCSNVKPKNNILPECSTKHLRKCIANLTPKQGYKKWTVRSNRKLLNSYFTYIKQHKYEIIDEEDLWLYVGKQLKRGLLQCRTQYEVLSSIYTPIVEQIIDGKQAKGKFLPQFMKLNDLKHKFKLSDCPEIEKKLLKIDNKTEDNQTSSDSSNSEKTAQFLKYYLENMEEFISPKFNKQYVWQEASKIFLIPKDVLGKKLSYLRDCYKIAKNKNNRNWEFYKLFEQIERKKADLLEKIAQDSKLPLYSKETAIGYDTWDNSETLRLLEWYQENVGRFHNHKYKAKFIWDETQTALGMNPDRCYKKMRDLRSTYRQKLSQFQRGNVKAAQWKHFDLLKKIYGTDLDNPFLARTKNNFKNNKIPDRYVY